MSNDSTLPSTFSFEASNWLSAINLKAEKISKIIQTLDQNKAPGHDDISVKICRPSIIKPLQLLFNKCAKQGVFANIWKMGKVLSVQKTDC